MKVITGFDCRDSIALVTKENGSRKVKYVDMTDWYFYIKLEDYEKAKPILDKYTGSIVKEAKVGKRYVKVCSLRILKEAVTIDTVRYELANLGVDVFEFDLNKTKRYMIDNNIEIEDDMDILYFDIETDDSKGGIEIGRDRIISFAACSKKKVYFEMGDEKEILEKFVKLIKKYDCLVGWNSEAFDLPYIQMRCQVYGIDYNWKTIIHVDMMQRCFKLYSFQMSLIGLKNFKLNEVARCFLGSQKTELSGMKIHQLEKEKPELLKEYNIQDAKLLLQLDEKLHILPLMINECKMTGSFMNKFYIGELLDNYILRRAKANKIILNSRPNDLEYAALENVQITGGYVAEPLKGLYDDVHICDFKSLYPSIIISWNIGIDTLNKTLTLNGANSLQAFLGPRRIEEVCYLEWTTFLKAEKLRLDPNDEYLQTCNNAFFLKSKPSFYSDTIEELLNLRKEYKKKLKDLTPNTPEYINHHSAEMVIKEMANSMFGITCDKRSRYFNKFVSEGITYTGQYLNKCSSDVVSEIGLKSIYGDTDSLFVIGSPDLDIVKVNQILSERLIRDFHLSKYVVKLEYEKKYRKLLLLEKKTYTGVLSMKDDKPVDMIFSHGTMDIHKTKALIGRKCFTEFTNKIFRENLTIDDAQIYVIALKNKIFTEPLNLDELILTNKISKKIENFKTLSVQARLAKKLIAEGELLEIVENKKGYGTRLEYIMVNIDGKREGELQDHMTHEPDRVYYWDVQIYAPIKRVLECVWPDFDWKKYLGELNPQPKVKKTRAKKVKQQKLL
jgi:DNA polymerase I